MDPNIWHISEVEWAHRWAFINSFLVSTLSCSRLQWIWSQSQEHLTWERNIYTIQGVILHVIFTHMHSYAYPHLEAVHLPVCFWKKTGEPEETKAMWRMYKTEWSCGSNRDPGTVSCATMPPDVTIQYTSLHILRYLFTILATILLCHICLVYLCTFFLTNLSDVILPLSPIWRLRMRIFREDTYNV